MESTVEAPTAPETPPAASAAASPNPATEVRAASEGERAGKRDLVEITPPRIFGELQKGVLGQDKSLRFVAVSVYKHTTGKVAGNVLLIGNSGTGKTTIMNNIQRLYQKVPEYRPFRTVAIINANLLVDADRMEFRPDRLLAAVEQRARSIVGERPSPAELQEAIERATLCIDEIDKMSSILAGKPNPLGVVLQQGLLTLMEGEKVTYPTHAWVDGREKDVKLEIDTKGMMFVCGGAFETLYDQVYERVTKPGSGEKLRKETMRTADGQVKIETRFYLADMLKPKDLFDYGMVPQFMARFEKTVVLNELTVGVLKEILLKSFDSPFVRARDYFRIMDIELEIEEVAALRIAERASQESRTGARALRPIFSDLINPLEFDPWAHDALEAVEDGGHRLAITSEMVKDAIG